jgi:hypothetical protein
MASSQRQSLSRQDHDLLIRLDENVRGLRADVQELRTSTIKDVADLTGRVASLERESLQFPPHEHDRWGKEWETFKTERKVELANRDAEQKKRLFYTGSLSAAAATLLGYILQAVLR